MALKLEDKKSIVSEISEKASSALSVAIADYRGLTVNEMGLLRKEARSSDIYLKVIRNNLAKIALKGTEFECLITSFSGPLVLALSKEEPGAPAKLFKNFMKLHKVFEVKNLAVGGKLFDADKLEEISKLPNRKDASGILCNVLNAPMVKLVHALNGVTSKILNVLVAVSEATK